MTPKERREKLHPGTIQYIINELNGDISDYRKLLKARSCNIYETNTAISELKRQVRKLGRIRRNMFKHSKECTLLSNY